MSDDLDSKRFVDTSSGQQMLEIERVSSKIERHVRRFCVVGRSFHMDELTEYVRDQIQEPIAPESPGRILRQLRLDGKLNYEVDRSSSSYSIIEGFYEGCPPSSVAPVPTRGQLREAYKDLRELYKLWTRRHPGVELSDGFIAVAQWVRDAHQEAP